MEIKKYFLATIILLTCVLNGNLLKAQEQGGIPSPESHFGYKPGADNMLMDYEELISYLKKLDAASANLKLVEIGESPLGKKMYIAFISSANNINNLEKLKEINRRLALDPDIPDKDRENLIEEGKVFFLATLSMHSSEVGPSQAAPQIAYELLTTDDHEMLSWMEDVVYMMVPCHNPDGMDMIVNHYRKYKGTKYDGCSMPGIYHKYVGHDNNRDFICLTQSDTKAIARIYNKDWFPQVMVEKHQMGSGGVRYYVPPNHDPIAENVDAGIWNWAGIFGSNMIKDMTKYGLAGVAQHYLFDDYWPGSTETCIWKNVIGFLTESASVKYATPVYVEPNEIRVNGKGLAEYKKSINMPLPWEGGWWRLGDIVDYERISTYAIIKTSSKHKNDILIYRNDICKKEIERGRNEPPFYYILPEEQHDKSEFVNLVELLDEHGVEIYSLNGSVVIDDRVYDKGDIVIPLAQPFRAFIKEVMEAQVFPLRHYTPDGEIIKPYDITSWSLPLHRNVRSFEINIRSQKLEGLLEKITLPYTLNNNIPDDIFAAVFSVNNNESFKAAFTSAQAGMKVERIREKAMINGKEMPQGSFIVYDKSGNTTLKNLIRNLKVAPEYTKEQTEIKTTSFNIPRIALTETWFHDMDAGWTRYVFDEYNIPYTVIRPGDFEKTDLESTYDVIIFPNEDKSMLMTGKRKRRDKDEYFVTSYPPEYTKGIGKKGMQNLLTFIDNGGVIISWGQSPELFMGTLVIDHEKGEKEEFKLPVNDLSDHLRRSGFFCPGGFLKLNLKEGHPITMGMGKESGAFFRHGTAFSTSIPVFDTDRRVIGVFPEKDILISGYCENEEKIGNMTSIVWLKKNKGQLVLFGFNPQFRASTPVTYKLLFNSLLLK